MIGNQLSSLLESKGYEVRLLTRNPNLKSNYKSFVWDIDNNSIDDKAFENLDHIIHLAGAGIADKKWTEKRKQIIIDSRVKSTELLFEAVKRLKAPIKTFISSSAIGYYGSVTSDIIFTENHKSAQDFLGQVCSLWEKAINLFLKEKIRTCIIRTGIVLSNKGGALKKMKTPVVTPLGNGKQYMPWIHIEDLCNIYIKAIEDKDMNGVYNGVAPEHITNSSFSKQLASAFKRPFLPIGAPSFLLKIAFGEMATILLNGSRISSSKIKEAGFSFKYLTLKKALESFK